MYQIFSGTKQGIEDFLNGNLVASMRRGGLPVGGLTLEFTTPVATVTFPGAAGTMLSAEAIRDAINAVITDVALLRNTIVPHMPADYTGRPNPGVELVLRRVGGWALDGALSTALPHFRFPLAASPISQADIVAFQPDASKGHFHVLVNP
jgi:hypothetical protein